MNVRKCKTVSFDNTEEYELELLAYAEAQDKCFSKYVKRLIAADRSGTSRGPGTQNNPLTNECPLDVRPDAYIMEAMGGFLCQL